MSVRTVEAEEVEEVQEKEFIGINFQGVSPVLHGEYHSSEGVVQTQSGQEYRLRINEKDEGLNIDLWSVSYDQNTGDYDVENFIDSMRLETENPFDDLPEDSEEFRDLVYQEAYELLK